LQETILQDRDPEGDRACHAAALQERWDRLRAGLDLVLDQRGADMADLRGGASGLLVSTIRERSRSAGDAHHAPMIDNGLATN
jgi:hypothetical protein